MDVSTRTCVVRVAMTSRIQSNTNRNQPRAGPSALGNRCGSRPSAKGRRLVAHCGGEDSAVLSREVRHGHSQEWLQALATAPGPGLPRTVDGRRGSTLSRVRIMDAEPPRRSGTFAPRLSESGRIPKSSKPWLLVCLRSSPAIFLSASYQTVSPSWVSLEAVFVVCGH